MNHVRFQASLLESKLLGRRAGLSHALGSPAEPGTSQALQEYVLSEVLWMKDRGVDLGQGTENMVPIS